MLPSVQSNLWISEDGSDIPVSLPDGRRIIIGANPREIPAGFIKAARAAGAITTRQVMSVRETAAAEPKEHASADPLKRQALLREALIDIADNAEDPAYEEAITQTGLPSLIFLSQRLGFSVQPDERNKAWAQLQHDIRDAEADAATDNAGNTAAANQGPAAAELKPDVAPVAKKAAVAKAQAKGKAKAPKANLSVE